MKLLWEQSDFIRLSGLLDRSWKASHCSLSLFPDMTYGVRVERSRIVQST